MTSDKTQDPRIYYVEATDQIIFESEHLVELIPPESCMRLQRELCQARAQQISAEARQGIGPRLKQGVMRLVGGET